MRLLLACMSMLFLTGIAQGHVDTDRVHLLVRLVQNHPDTKAMGEKKYVRLMHIDTYVDVTVDGRFFRISTNHDGGLMIEDSDGWALTDIDADGGMDAFFPSITGPLNIDLQFEEAFRRFDDSVNLLIRHLETI